MNKDYEVMNNEETKLKQGYWIYTIYGVRFTSADRVSIDENNTLRFEEKVVKSKEPVYTPDADNNTELVVAYIVENYEFVLIGAYSDGIWKSFGLHLATDEVEEDEIS